jgi:DNA-directed RNA polymerase subunit RPC12/RpoP
MRYLSFRCGGCRARIKAPRQMRGQRRACPGCGHRFVVQPQRIEDSGPVLVSEHSSTHHSSSSLRAW